MNKIVIEKLINILKNKCSEDIIKNIRLININNKEELIRKGILFDNEYTCYNNYESIDDIITGLMVSADNYGIYLEDEFIGIVSMFYQYYKDLTRYEISICIKKEYRNINVGKYCFNYVISDCFKNTDIKSIHLSIREDNIKSRKVAENCGFKLYPGYKNCKLFYNYDGTLVSQVQYLLKRKDYMQK